MSATTSRFPVLRARPRSLLPALRLLATALGDAVAADQDRLVLWLPAALGSGILLYFALPTEPPVWIGTVATLLALVGLVAARRSRVAPRLVHALAAIVLAAALGLLSAQLCTARLPPMPVLPRKAVLVEGIVAEAETLADGRQRVILSGVTLAPADPDAPVQAGPAGSAGPKTLGARRLRISLPGTDPLHPLPGSRVRIRALLQAPAEADYPGGRDPRRDAFFAGLAGSGRALSPMLVLEPPRGGGPGAWLRRTREAVAARIMAVLPGPRGAVAATLLTGLSSAIPQSDRDAFAAAGLAHLLAVAGLHLGIVMGLFLTLVRAGLAAWEWGALRLPCRQIAALSALTAGAAYMLLTGLHLPGLRALAMATVAMLGLLIGRRAISLRALCLAALLLLLVSPSTILDVSYQMSFAAVLALLAGYEAARPLTLRLTGAGFSGRLGLHLFQLVFTSLVAGAASLPYAAFHFGRVQFYFVLANLVAVPLTAFWVLPQGLIALLMLPFGLDWPFLRAMGGGIGLILWLARTVASFPAASLAVPAAPGWGLLVVSAGLMWLCLWRRRWRLLALLPILVGCASPWLRAPPDLLLSADAGLLAVREPGVLLTQVGGRNDAIVLADWRRALAVTAPEQTLQDSSGFADLVCNPVACLLTRHGGTAMLLAPPASHRPEDETAITEAVQPGDCDDIALLLAQMPSHGVCAGVRRIDRFTVWAEGPHAVWLRPHGVVVWSARDAAGARPWTAPVPGHEGPTLPLAKAE